MTDFFAGQTPESAAALNRDMDEVLDRLLDYRRRQREDGSVVLSRIVPHELPAEEIRNQILAQAEGAGLDTPAEAELKAYTTRAAGTGTIAQQLLNWHESARAHPETGLPYTLALGMLATDDLQFHDVFAYLMAVRHCLDA
ncbi:hypothetical protein [Streptomyces aureocirculatus]|uniref:hypothetical protein n=1 Tax=Streptomyces aureocirculatus TaxID=67275 RepID=UPI0014706C7E|nr:hypothetical protein [Streptomyces aureocirculatus]